MFLLARYMNPSVSVIMPFESVAGLNKKLRKLFPGQEGLNQGPPLYNSGILHDRRFDDKFPFCKATVMKHVYGHIGIPPGNELSHKLACYRSEHETMAGIGAAQADGVTSVDAVSPARSSTGLT